jgi:hypothetical protein
LKVKVKRIIKIGEAKCFPDNFIIMSCYIYIYVVEVENCSVE